MNVSPVQQAYLQGYGPFGRLLAQQAAAGSAEAAYQAAVLLACDDSSAHEAMPLLLHAAAAGHAHAAQLLAGTDLLDRPDRWDAAGYAYELAEAAARQSRTSIAFLWYGCAARIGLPDAAMKLALCHQARGDEQLAVGWLAVAAEHGYTRAEIRLAELRKPGRLPPLPPVLSPPSVGHHAAGGARTPYN